LCVKESETVTFDLLMNIGDRWQHGALP